jgi:Putative metal-binding motif
VRIYNRALSAQEVKDLYIATNQFASGDCLDSSGAISPLSKWYKDSDNDGVSDGTMVQQCASLSGYKLASALTLLTGDCNDSNPAIYSGAVEICNLLDEDCDINPYNVSQISSGQCEALVSLYTATAGS